MSPTFSMAPKLGPREAFRKRLPRNPEVEQFKWVVKGSFMMLLSWQWLKARSP